MSKPFWKSKTMIFNVLALLLAIAEAFGFVNFVPAEETGQIAMVIITIINLILRFKTNTSVTTRQQ